MYPTKSERSPANNDSHQPLQQDSSIQQKSIIPQTGKARNLKVLFNTCAQVQRFDRLQAMSRNSPQARQTAQLKMLMHNSPAVLAQRKKMELYKQLQEKKQAQIKENRNTQVVQRAIGFELEVPSWRVQHMNDKSRLPKNTEPVIESEGFKLAADDAGKESDIEFVTDAIENPAYLMDVMKRLAKLGQALEKYNNGKKAIPATKFKKHGTPNSNAEFLPGDSMRAHIQATIGMPLEKLPALYESLASGYMGGLAAPDAGRSLKIYENSLTQPYPALLDKQLSAPLKGFLLLVIDYILAGFVPLAYRKQVKPFPKDVFHLLAKTNFTKILDLVPEKAQLLNESQELKEEWIDWIVEVALRKMYSSEAAEDKVTKIDDPLLGNTFGEDKENTYAVDIKTREWLKQMPKKDILTEQEDNRLEGIGSYKNAADQLVSKPERVEMAEKMTKSFFSFSKKPKPDIKDEKQKGRLAESVPASTPEGFSTEAPIFELRKIDMEGEPSKWPEYAINIDKIYQHLLQGLVYRKKDKQPVPVKK